MKDDDLDGELFDPPAWVWFFWAALLGVLLWALVDSAGRV